MAFIDKLYDKNFLEYASYVIKDRAIPDIADGLKPVQRRILHSLFEMDDGHFNKVANVVGSCMKYHPHGDASIYSALVVLANKELFIDRQGNFGNIFTGDPPSAARYIECRLLPLAKEALFNPEITETVPSYDGRNKEPVAYPAKIPVALIHGAEGIAVGMATKILPHNFVETLQAQIAALKGKPFELFPDFQTGGMVDVSEYEDGNGKIRSRARIDDRDPKKIVIRELPFGQTTESLVASIEAAAKKNKLKIAGISDYTAEVVEIEVRLARGVRSRDTIEALYAFTDCEVSVSPNLMLIDNNEPKVFTVTEVVLRAAEQIQKTLKAELELELGHLKDRLHAKTLEQIFIENRIYKLIEDKKTADGVTMAVVGGLKPFHNEIKRDVTKDDVDTLLKIPIRRISQYDIDKARNEMAEIRKRIKEIRHHLTHLVDYAISFLEGLIEKYGKQFPRQTEIVSIDKVDVREAAKRDLKLRYDRNTGYLGFGVASGVGLFDVSVYDRVLVIRKSGAYSLIDVPEKLFVDKGMVWCGFVDKDLVYTAIFKNKKTSVPFIKRCKLDKFILNKGYALIPDDCALMKLTTSPDPQIQLEYKPKPRVRILEETFNAAEYAIRGAKAGGIRLANREVKSAKFLNIANGDDDGGEDSES